MTFSVTNVVNHEKNQIVTFYVLGLNFSHLKSCKICFSETEM